ncbi:MAG TPA: twin-arginine translocation signal domain-containing protein [Xanthobacteraceae bacterium]|nr:twin-arginine translocation signal domain-containing protein [Xanthobacteraceae bacterium]
MKTEKKEKKEKKVARRDFLRALGAGAGVAVTASGPLVREAAADESNDEKRKARYQADSPDVQAYYRVNRYPAK